MPEKILFVDDEPNILQSIKRNLRKQFEVETAEGGQQALDLMNSSGPFAVIVSDMKMPGMNGVQFLSQAKQIAPESVRMMLTGNADQETAVAAVNDGDIFRFLNKPCDAPTLAAAVEAALSHHRLITVERDLLQNTLRASIQALAEVLSLTNPEVYGRTTRYKNTMQKLAKEMGIEDDWRMETVALLSQIGCVTVPEEIVKKKISGALMREVEIAEFQKHTVVGSQILAAIPRMDEVAECIRYQEQYFDGSGYPAGGRKGEDIPMGARLLRVILDYDTQENILGKSKALGLLKSQSQLYDPAVLQAFESMLHNATALAVAPVSLSALEDSMILAKDVSTSADILLVSKGQQTTASVRRHLRNFFAKGQIGNTVLVWMDPARIK